MQGAQAGAPRERERRDVDRDTLLEERLFTGLRLDQGLLADALMRARFEVGAAEQITGGFLEDVGGRWRLSAKGRPIMDRVVLAVISPLNRR